MTGQVTALVALTGAVLLLGLLSPPALGRRKRSAVARPVARSSARKPPPRGQRGALPSAPVPAVRGATHAEPRRPAVRMAFARPGMRGPLFQYGGDGPGFELDPRSPSSPSAPPASRRTTATASSRSPSPGWTRGPPHRRVLDAARPRPRRRPDLHARHLRQRGPRGPHVRGHRRRDLARLDGAIVVAHDAVRRALPRRRVRPGRRPAAAQPGAVRAVAGPATIDRPAHELRSSRGPPGCPSSTGTAPSRRPHRGPAAAQMLAATPERCASCRPPAAARTRVDAPPRRPAGRARGASTSAGRPRCCPGRRPTRHRRDAQRYLDALTVALADGRLLGGEARRWPGWPRPPASAPRQVIALHQRLLDTFGRPRRPTRSSPPGRSASCGPPPPRSACRPTSTSCALRRRRTSSPAARCRCPAAAGRSAPGPAG